MTKSGSDLIAEAKARVREIDAAQAVVDHKKGGTIFLDVREPGEWNLGHLPNAIHIPRGQLEGQIEATIDRDTDVVIYCARGSRSALAADTLQQMGYKKVVSLAGGFRAWAEGGGDIED